MPYHPCYCGESFHHYGDYADHMKVCHQRAIKLLEKADRFMVGGNDQDPIHIEKMRQLDGSILWAVRKGGRVAMSKLDGRWYIEPVPSNRDEEFFREFRFATYQEAEQAFIAQGKQTSA